MPDRNLPYLPLRSSNYCTTHHYDICLKDGFVFIRAGSSDYGSTDWTLLQNFKTHSGDVTSSLFQALENRQIQYITADEGNVLLVTKDNQPFYGKLDENDDAISWNEQWGLKQINPLKKSHLQITDNLIMITMSHTPSYKYRLDGNNVNHPNLFGITTVAAIDIDTGYIVISDPWWRSTFSHKICPPKQDSVYRLSYSASTFFIYTEQGDIYTFLYDLDTGQNPLIRYRYSPEAFTRIKHNKAITNVQKTDTSIEQNERSMSFSFIKDALKKRHLPMGVWISHNNPKDMERVDNVTILQCGENTRDDFKLYIWGVRRLHNQQSVYGYYTKDLYATNWHFVEVSYSKVAGLMGKSVYNEPVIPPPTLNMGGSFFRRGSDYQVCIKRFNPYRDYNRMTVMLTDGTTAHLYLFINLRADIKHHSWCKATVMLGKKLRNSKSSAAVEFKEQIFGNKSVQTMLMKREQNTWHISAMKFNPRESKHRLRLQLDGIENTFSEQVGESKLKYG